jgi:SAM-dependent methyltransferase
VPQLPARDRFLALLRQAATDGTLVKLTLGKPAPGAADATLRNVFVRPVELKSGPHLTFVWRHDTRDVTKNYRGEEALTVLELLLGREFLDGHLFTPAQTAQVETTPDGKGRLRVKLADAAPAPVSARHDRTKVRTIAPDTGWLRDLGVTGDTGEPREGMAPKLRQIERFAELLQHLAAEAHLPSPEGGKSPLVVADMGCGKGYLTFALATVLGPAVQVTGLDTRAELIERANMVAKMREIPGLTFRCGDIADLAKEPPPKLDVLVALHACDTATDEALAAGVRAGARLLIVSPCCHKQLRGQLGTPAVLEGALRHGIFRERQAEFVTDALRAELLEWAGYRTKVFEFVSTEHTAKNLMIAGIRAHPPGAEDRLRRIQALAAFYGVRHQRLAERLGVALA